ncbi:O-acyltransferase like protein-like isoform X2 [Diabrotica virgifera virgifera]|uniref:Acyltransferase 3 domain-containing protein n=1 Tax=Diabrotica virgifera virgifera TaxID=50390 RepID=A0ABM5K6F1_DIAVI|nr:O-acyltransferase like protein-like isoform X2 [Diabrotica virgifera virgifera]
MLPPLYKMAHYTQCAADPSNYYCSAQAELIVPSTNLNMNISLDISRFDRKFIYRTLCIPKRFIKDDFELNSYSSYLVNEEIEPFRLSAKVEDTTCNKIKLEMNAYDIIFLILVIVYNVLVIFATYKGKIYEKEQGFKKTISKLSLFHTWKIRSRIPDTTDFKNLLNVNGTRVLAMLYIICLHLFLIYHGTFISDPETFEHLLYTFTEYIIGYSAMYMVLHFFLISSWLLTIQVYNIHEKRQLTLKNIGILIINRYFRLNFSIFALMIFSVTSFATRLAGPANFYAVISNQKACNENWFASLFFFANFYRLGDICNVVTWHVSADFQLYVINLFLLYIKLKYKFNDIKFFATVLIFSMFLHGMVLQIFDADPIYPPVPRYCELHYWYSSLNFVVSYMSPASIWPSTLIGIIFGLVYIKTKNVNIKASVILNTIWCVTTLGLIYLSVRMGSVKINGVKRSMLGPIIKPLFCLGCAIGVYGMSHNLGGPVKKLMESKIFVVLSNFVYGIYLTHFLFLVLINKFNTEPIYINLWKMVQDYIISVILSLLFGIYFTLIVEEPGNMLQKKILPQITKWEKISKTN